MSELNDLSEICCTEPRQCMGKKDMIRIVTLIVGAFGGLLLASVAPAQQAPALYWTHIEMGAPEHCGGVSWCPTVAYGELSREGFNAKRDGTVGAYGSNRDSTVVVECVSIGNGGMWAGIFAAASDARTAERVRDNIAQKMRGAGCL